MTRYAYIYKQKKQRRPQHTSLSHTTDYIADLIHTRTDTYLVVCVILRLAVSVEHQLVTDGQTHDYSIYREPRCKNQMKKVYYITNHEQRNQRPYWNPCKCSTINGITSFKAKVQSLVHTNEYSSCILSHFVKIQTVWEWELSSSWNGQPLPQ